MANERAAAVEAGDTRSPSLAMTSELSEADRWTEPRERLAERLRRALAWRAWLDADSRRKASDIGRRERLSRARVCQILTLTKLAPVVVADLLHGSGPVPNERQLYALARLPGPEQEAGWRALCQPQPAQGGAVPAAKATHSKGFQHLFARARRYQELLDAGKVRSLEELGRAEGVTGNRIGQVLLLLHLAPEIIEALDVPPERCPVIAEKVVRRIARLRNPAEQVRMLRRAFASALPDRATG